MIKEPLLSQEKNTQSDLKDKEKMMKEVQRYTYKEQSPLKYLSFFSQTFFTWGLKIINLANIIKLSPIHLGKLPSKKTSDSFMKQIYHVYDSLSYKSIKKHFLLKTILRANISKIFILILLSLISTALNILSINLFRQYIIQFKKQEEKVKMYIYIGVSFLFVQLLNIFLMKQLNHLQNYLGEKAGIEMNCLIFDKILKRSYSRNEQKHYADSGEIINFIQLDSQKLTLVISLGSTAISLPIIILSYCLMLFLFLGWSFIFGFMTLFIFLGINFCLQNRMKNNQKQKQQCSDKRMKVTSEALFNLKGIKMYGWDNFFLNKINQSRENELSALRSIFNTTNIIRSLLWFSPVGTGIVTIGAYFYFNSSRKIEDLFTCLGILSSIQDPIRGLANVYTNIIEMFVSLKRVETFLNEDDINHKNITTNDKETIDKGIDIKIENGNYTWGAQVHNKNQIEVVVHDNNKEVEKSNKVALENINLSFTKGEFVCVIGDIGSGKTSLLQAILNNILPIKPKDNNTRLILNGTLAYVGQIPWIQSATMKNNILFYQPMKQEKYEEILERTDLLKDLDVLVKRDETEIGEKGVNLSGGQKARIAIARAMYANKDIFLLDDPIASLDANVGTKIMKECICNYLKGKTRILVTHSLQYLSCADRIIYMKDGHIEWDGKYHDLTKQDFYNKFFDKPTSSLIQKDHPSSTVITTKEKTNLPKQSTPSAIPNPGQGIDQKPLHVSLSIYLKYIKLIGGLPLMIVLVIIIILWQTMRGGADLWLAYWSKQNSQEFPYYFSIYSSLGIGASLFLFIRLIIISRGSIQGSRKLHSKMASKIIQAPINLYYDTIQKGQIINKLSKDLSIIDFFSSVMFGNILSFGATLISAIIICSIYQSYCLIFLPFLLSCGLYLMRFYLVCSRELTRNEAMTRTPIINIITEVNGGTDTIRAFHIEETFQKQFKQKSDDNFNVKLFISGTSQWFNLMLDLLSFILRCIVISFTIYCRKKFSPQIIGIVLTYLIQIEDNLTRFIMCFSTFENTMVALDRCISMDSIPSEKPNQKDIDKELFNSWPVKGSLSFNNVSVKYRSNTEVVLKEMTFDISAGEKIGIVGRTGSGKSTIALCIFRILELMEGRITIDNIDISGLGLEKLRNSITIIPQDPSLIEGTLKDNIDPLSLYSEEEIEGVMKEIGFNYISENNPMGLNQKVSENGSNYSSGEKQLICITRALLRKSKIVIMDEATSSVDYNSEECIRKAFKVILKDSTIITIAHRIKTIIDMDRIMVIDDGKLIEYDTPDVLMKNETSLFYQLYKKSTSL